MKILWKGKSPETMQKTISSTTSNPQGKNMGFFLLETLKTTIKMRNLTQDGHNQGIFFPKLGHFFSIFEKEQGRPPLPPSSYAPDVGLFIILKQVYISCCLIIMSTTTSHRLKQNNFLYRNLNHRNFSPVSRALKQTSNF